MTFKEWFHDYEWSPEKEAWGQSVWNAAQQAEREKYQELIAAAEAAVYSSGTDITAEIDALREVLVRINE